MGKNIIIKLCVSIIYIYRRCLSSTSYIYIVLLDQINFFIFSIFEHFIDFLGSNFAKMYNLFRFFYTYPETLDSKTISSACNNIPTVSMSALKPHFSLLMLLAKSLINKLKSKGDMVISCFTSNLTFKKSEYILLILIHVLNYLNRSYIALYIFHPFFTSPVSKELNAYLLNYLETFVPIAQGLWGL